MQEPEWMTTFNQSDCLCYTKLYYKDLTPAFGGQFGLANYERRIHIFDRELEELRSLNRTRFYLMRDLRRSKNRIKSLLQNG